MSTTEKSNGGSSIGSVERDTGIGRDTFRVWERGNGFPAPARDTKGERIYSAEQVRRLLDQGLRQGLDRRASSIAQRLPRWGPPSGHGSG